MNSTMKGTMRHLSNEM